MEPSTPSDPRDVPPADRARVAVTYCTQCNWLLRAAWVAQELLQTFGTDLGEVALVPGTGGVFRVEVAGTPVWDRRTDGGMPDVVELKRRVRDLAAPHRALGHADRAATRRAPDPRG